MLIVSAIRIRLHRKTDKHTFPTNIFILRFLLGDESYPCRIMQRGKYVQVAMRTERKAVDPRGN